MKIKNSFIIVFLVNLIIRIPRMLSAQGLDGFIAIWEAKLILSGNYFQNGFNIFTLLGMTPFSGYPIGILLILCFFLIISFRNVMAAILLYDLFFTIIFVLCTYYLASELELKQSAKIYFILILTTLPNIFTFSYYTSSARYPLFALLPFLFALLLKFNREKKPRYLIIATVLSIVLNFIHRMAIILFAIIILSLLFLLIEKITKREFLKNFHTNEVTIDLVEHPTRKEELKRKFVLFYNYFKKRLWIFGIIGLFTIGFITFGLKFSNVYYSAKYNIYCYIIAIIDCEYVYLATQPLVDQWFHYGIPFILFIISLIMMLIPKFENSLEKINKNTSNLKLIYFVLPFVLIYHLIYSFYYLAYIVSIQSALFIQYVEDKKYRHYLWPITGILVGSFITIYHYLTETKVLPYLIIGLFIISISIIAIFLLRINITRNWLSIKFGQTNSKLKLSIVFFIGIIIFNSMFIVDRSFFTNRGQSIYENVTQEEKEIAEFLSQNGYGTFDSFDYTVSAHIAALSGWYFIQDQHNLGIFLLENRTVNNISCSLSVFSDWLNIQFFNCSFTDGKQILYRQLFVTECMEIDAIRILKTYNIRYFISSRHFNSAYAWQYIVESAFIKSLYDYVPIVKTTENYFVWNTSTLYS